MSLCHNVSRGHETCHKNFRRQTQNRHNRGKSSREKRCAAPESCRAPACRPSAQTGCRSLMVCHHCLAAAHLPHKFVAHLWPNLGCARSHSVPALRRLPLLLQCAMTPEGDCVHTMEKKNKTPRARGG
eukprot:scaffold1034_cov127-Isochrysis_galbana.AAC.1